MTPLESQTVTFSALMPRSHHRLRQEIAAAPAPEQTTLTSPIALSTTLSALSIAAAEMIAVPCWSSWKTGIAMRSLSLLSM